MTTAAGNQQPAQNESSVCPVLVEQHDKLTQRAFGRNIANLPQKAVLITKKPMEGVPEKAFIKIAPQESSVILSNNPQECAEYAEEIEQYTKSIETKYMTKPNYMTTQPDVNEKMRAILIDWMVDVHLKFKLGGETLFLAVNVVDRFLEKEVIARQKLQLVGVAALLIASKYDEIYPPEIKDFVYISDNAYTKPEVISMEQKVLRALGYDLNFPSSYRFLQRYSKLLAPGTRVSNMAMYMIELALVEYKCLKHRPSVCAAAALYLSNRLINKDTEWDKKIGDVVGYNEASLKQCARELAAIMQGVTKSSLQAVKRKYSLPLYTQVSNIRIGKRS